MLGLGAKAVGGREYFSMYCSYEGAQRSVDLDGSGNLSDRGGFLIAQFTPNDLPTGNEYPLIVDDGSTNNLIGIRLYAGSMTPGYWIRGNGGNLVSAVIADSNLLPGMALGSRVTVGLSWDNELGAAYIYYNGGVTVLDISGARITGLTRLNIKSRDNDGEFDSTVHFVAAGSDFIAPAFMEQLIAENTGRLAVAGAGQSLELGYIYSQETSGQSGYDAMLDSYEAATGREVFYVDLAQGGSSLFKKNSTVSEYWWDEDTDSPGTMLTQLYDRLDAFNIKPHVLSWSQGEQDALFLDMASRPTGAEYKAKLQLLFEDVRARYGNVQIYLKVIGRRTGANPNVGGVQAVRNAQLELIEELDYLHFGGEQYHVGLTDTVHPDDAGYAEIGAAQGRIMAGGSAGPRISGWSRSGAAVTVNIAHDGGTDITPSASIEGFTFMVDGAPVSISSAVRTDASTITLSLASTPSGSTEELYYIYDASETLDIAYTVRDNSAHAMPLRSYKG